MHLTNLRPSALLYKWMIGGLVQEAMRAVSNDQQVVSDTGSVLLSSFMGVFASPSVLGVYS